MVKQFLFITILFLVQFHASAQAPTSDTLELELSPFSLPTDNVKDGFYKAETEQEYKALQNQVAVVPGDPPFKYDYPKINFKKYILMGGVFHMNSCEKVTQEERLYELTSQRKIVYKLYFVQFGQCAESVLMKHWVVVKKKKGYTYQFNNRLVETKETKQ
jgi:hypothetical protein